MFGIIHIRVSIYTCRQKSFNEIRIDWSCFSLSTVCTLVHTVVHIVFNEKYDRSMRISLKLFLCTFSKTNK